jgi:hypothetical protein
MISFDTLFFPIPVPVFRMARRLLKRRHLIGSMIPAQRLAAPVSL